MEKVCVRFRQKFKSDTSAFYFLSAPILSKIKFKKTTSQEVQHLPGLKNRSKQYINLKATAKFIQSRNLSHKREE